MKQLLSLLLLTVCCLPLLLAGGCSLVGALAYKTTGPAAIPAKYAPPKEPMLILVEDYRAASSDLDSDQLARYLAEDFKANKVGPLVDFDTLAKVKDKWGEQYRKMSVEGIGREADAKQVLWVKVMESSVESLDASTMVQGHLAVKVKIIDVATGTTRFPIDAADGEPLRVETPYADAAVENRELVTRQKLCQQMAEKIGKLFHEWKPDYDE